MSTSKIAMKLRLSQESYSKLHQLHPGYGESQRVVRELVEGYLQCRQANRGEIEALADSILRKVRPLHGNENM